LNVQKYTENLREATS
jgi:U3 small nucleolar ribonucleoprotein protein IMP3